MTPFCAAVDWGTTSFRIWVLNGSGAPLAQRRSAEGMANCAPDRFTGVLEAHLDALDAPTDLPVIICGMAGARQGWVEAPYLDTPTPLAAIASSAVHAPFDGRDVWILPGIAMRAADQPDVMRGEETQLLGLDLASGPIETVCIPGTHSKWITIERESILAFRTFMTGDLFAAIGRHTILSHATEADHDAFSTCAFDRAVRASFNAPAELTARLFAIRAGHLLEFSTAGEAAATLSGLLIGTEIGAAVARYRPSRPVRVVATGALADRYQAAFRIAGVEAEPHDSETAALQGLFRAAKQLTDPNGTNLL